MQDSSFLHLSVLSSTGAHIRAAISLYAVCPVTIFYFPAIVQAYQLHPSGITCGTQHQNLLESSGQCLRCMQSPLADPPEGV